MSKKHTPGPWRPSFVGNICIGVEKEISKGYTEVLFNTILPTTDAQYKKEKSVIEANATLIAAAPEMYKALKLIAECFPKSVIEDQLGEDSDIVFNAIEKAEGGNK